MQNKKDLAWIEVDYKALIHNLKVIRNQIGPGVPLAVCVKGNAYGHGLLAVSRTLVENGTQMLAVSSLAEAEQLRSSKFKIPLIILSGITKFEAEKSVRLKVVPNTYAWPTIVALQKSARKLNKKITIHIKVETGMNRLGVPYNDSFEFVKNASQLSNIKVKGLATHLSSSEVGESIAVKIQLEKFRKLKNRLEENGIKIPYYHCANSGGIFLYPKSIFNLVRPGVIIYGLFPGGDVAAYFGSKGLELKPVLSFKTRIIQIKAVPQNEGVSYGSSFKTKRRTRIAVLPVGYFDGVSRGLSNIGCFLVGGKRCKILGKVCMNLTMVDVTDLPKAEIGDEAVFIGRQKNEEIKVDEVANQLGTINYEVVTRLRESLPRYYI